MRKAVVLRLPVHFLYGHEMWPVIARGVLPEPLATLVGGGP